MAGKNQVTLTFAGESGDLEKTLKQVARAAEKMAREVGGSQKKMAKDADENDIGERLAKKMLGGIRDILTVGTKPIAITVATAFSTQFLGALGSGLASGVGKLAHGVGAGFALLPAAVLSGALALGTFKIAMLGVGDALKAGMSGDTEAFAEALKGLAPEAQKVVRELAGMKGALDQVKSGVQGNFFAPLIGQLRPLGDTYLPMIGGELMNIAAEFGNTARSMTDFLRLPSTAQQVSSAVMNAGAAARNMIAGLGGIGKALLPLVAVGATFLPGLTSGFAGATERLAAFMQHAAATGQIATFIQGGIDKLASLWETTGRVVDLFRQLGDIGATIFGGLSLTSGGLLDVAERLVTQFQNFLGTAQGTELLGKAFEMTNAVAGNLFGTFQRIGGILGRTFAPVLPELMDFMTAFLNLKTAILDSGLDLLEPALGGLADGLDAVLPAATGLTNWLAKTRPALAAVAAVITTLMIPALVAWTQKQALAILAQGKQIVANAKQVASWAASAASAVASAATTAAAWVAAGASMVASMVASAASAVASFAVMVGGWVAAGAAAVVNAALVVASWIAMAVQAAISAAAMAIAWIIAMGPIILAVAAVIAIIALLIIHWDTVKSVAVAAMNLIWGAVQSVFSWIQANWPLLLAILTGPIGLAVLAIVRNWDTIKSAVTAVKDWIVDRFNDVVGFFAGIPGRISAIATNMWTGLKDSFRNVLNGIISLWNNLSFTLPKINIPSVDVPGLGKIGGGSWGGQSFSTPNVPHLHTGGTFAAPPGKREGLAMLLDGEKVTRPGGLAPGGGGDRYEVHVYGSIRSERDFFQAVEDAIASGRLRIPKAAA